MSKKTIIQQFQSFSFSRRLRAASGSGLQTFFLFLMFVLLSGASAQAATFTVNQTGDAGDLTCDATCTLRDAIDDANNLAGADTITFDAGVFSTPQTIVLAGTVLTINDVGNAPLTITGPGASLLTISGNEVVRVFAVESGDTASISGVTVTQGNSETGLFAGHGGGIVNNGTLTITNVVVTGNTARFSGGGIAVFGSGTLNVINSTVTNNTARVTSASATTGGGGGGIINFNGGSTVNISGSTITGNSSARGGGGVYNVTSTLNVTDSTISNNIANTTSDSDSGGGGIINFSGVMTITNSIVSGNEARALADNSQFGRGGGISIFPGNSLTTITNSTITDNRAFSSGGGISYQDNGGVTGVFLTVTNSTISNNIANSDSNASGGGGGLFLTGSGSVTITGSTINLNASNTGAAGSSSGGGGINVSLSLTMTNSTISGNNAGRNGGGIFASSIVTINSSTIVSNTATMDGGGVFSASTTNPPNLGNTIVANNTDDGTAPDIFGTVNSNGFNLIENTTGATVTGDTATNITGQDPNLGPLQNNGGMTFTHALLPGSPAIDKGNSFDLTTDQRGQKRPVDFPSIPPATDGDDADIGAFEVQASPTAASVSISGRILAGKRGVARALIYLTDQNGDTKTVRTNQLGYYQFEDVAAGENYVLQVFSKQYQFAPQIISVTGEMNDLNFSAL